MTRKGDADRMRAVSLAGRAYRAAFREDWPAANAVMAEIGRQSPNVIALVLVAWCDTALAGQRQAAGMPELEDGKPAGELVQLVWADEEAGRWHADADAVPPAARWAGRLLAARAALDLEAFQALLRAMPADGHERGAYGIAVLMNCVKSTARPDPEEAAS